MKKIYFALLFSIPFLINGQTITQADLPHAGTAFTMGNDTTFTAPVPAGGMSQVWDYSGLIKSPDRHYRIYFGSRYAVCFIISVFELCYFRPMQRGYSYFTSSATGLYINGFVKRSSVLVFDPSQLFIPVPFSFGSTVRTQHYFKSIPL